MSDTPTPPNVSNFPPNHRVVLREFGETPLDALDHHFELLAEDPAPEIGALAPTDVLIKVRSAAVGWVDLIMSSGQYQHMVQPPYTPGLEYAGEVAWMGSEVEGFALGDRVIADGLQTGPRSLGRHQTWGGFAGWSVAPAHALIRLPEALSFDQGANLLGNYETAYHCLIHRGRLAAGETVLINGATGSTGLAAVDIAKRVGATVIATGRRADKLETVRARGADHVIAIASEDGASIRPFRDDVKALTGGKGVDVVYDGVGGEVSLQSLRCVNFGARFLIVGWASTPFVARGKGKRGAPNVNVLPTNLILMKSLDVLGCPAAISVHKDPSVRTRRLEDLLAWAEAGEIQPHVEAVYPLAEIDTALRAKWRSEHVGGCVVHPW